MILRPPPYIVNPRNGEDPPNELVMISPKEKNLHAEHEIYVRLPPWAARLLMWIWLRRARRSLAKPMPTAARDDLAEKTQRNRRF